VSPPPDVSQLSPTALSEALRALPYRQAAFLIVRLVQGRSLEASATYYGISPAAFSVHLLRAALNLAGVLALPCRPPAEDAEEDLWARGLEDALEREVAVPPGLTVLVALCRRLREAGQEVTAELESFERAEAESPRRQREDQLRRLVVLALLALTAFLYWNRA
jgi:hypothetical protein